ncbi:MAG: rhamnulokinase, partial [Rhodothermales bacterium]
AILGTLEDGRMHLEEVHRFETPLLEEQEQLFWDLGALWRELRLGLALAREQAPRLKSLSVDSWAVDYVPLGADGQPLRNPYAYRDPRTQGRLAQATDVVPARELYERTGIQMLEINSLYQLLADLDEEPDVLSKTKQRLLIADYFLYRFSGRAVAERTMASTTQLMDVRSGQWDAELMQRFGLEAARWPEIVAPGTRLGPLVSDVEHTGDAPVVIATCSHDTAAAVAAVPAEGERWAYLSSGTWSLMGVERMEPVLTDEALQANFTNEAGLDGTIRLLKNLTGLWVLEECVREWREDGATFSYDDLMAEAAAAPSFRRYVDLSEGRFTLRGGMRDKLRSYCREHQIPVPRQRGAVVRLILESLAESYRKTLRTLEALTGEPVDVLHVVGGGSKNALLCRLTADRCGCRVLAGPAEATALGNLILQARTLGDLPEGLSIRDVVRRSRPVQTYESAQTSASANPTAPNPITPNA